MDSIVAHTKFLVPPPRSAWVRRNDLLDRLESAETPLLLVRAPAGYGKSTLLGQFAHHRSDSVIAWVGLEESENDPVQFWRCVVGSLRRSVPDFAEVAWAEVNGPAPALAQSVVPQLINELGELPERLLLMLDDYHLISNATVHDTMRLFVSHLPRPTQVAVATRSVPGFPISRLRANRMMTEITSLDLAFSDKEIEEVLLLADRAVTQAATAGVRADTEGWPTGVYLATLGGTHTKSDGRRVPKVAVREYLMDEMLNEFATEEREFLRATSVLEPFNGALCDHVTGQSGSSELLNKLASSNLLLVPLDDDGEWFRFHHLLRDVLRAELTRRDPDRAAPLHLRAARWLAENGFPSEAIHHAIDANELLLAAELVCFNFWEFLNSGRFVTVEQWIERLPDRIFVDYPPLAVYGAFSAAFSGEGQRARRLCEAASTANFGGPLPNGHFSFESLVALLRSALYPGGVADAVRAGQLTYSLEPPQSPWRSYAAATYGAALFASGDFENAISYLTEGSSAPDPTIASYGFGQLAVLNIWRGDWDQASRLAAEALAIVAANLLEGVATSTPAFAAAAAIAARGGKSDVARKHIRSMSATKFSGYPDLALEVGILAAETCLEMGDIKAAATHGGNAATALDILGDGGHYAERLADVLTKIGRAESSTESPPEAAALTVREQQVLRLLPSVLTVREIGERLYISHNTAKTHTRRIYQKLGVGERSAAVARARELGLLEQSES